MSYEISKYPVEKLDPNADIQPGFAFKSERFTDNPDDIPLVKGENVHQGYIDWHGAKHWPADEYDSLSKYHLVPGDVVLAMDRPWVTSGLKWSYIKSHDPNSLLVQRVARIRAKNKLDQDYLRHVISSSYFANYLQPIVTGVNVPHISGKQIGAFRIPIPDPKAQRKIAAILTAYDDLFEVNKRRIALLENMAEEIYREWFVRLRFPGHQHTRFVKGVPEGWDYDRINTLVDFQSGYSFKSEYYNPFGRFGIVTIKNVHDGTFIPNCSDYMDEAPSNMKPHCYLNSGDILLSLTGNVGRVCRVYGNNLLLNQRVAKLRPVRERSKCFVYLFFKQPNIMTFCEMIATGAAQQNLSPIKIGNQKTVIPPAELLHEFEGKVAPLFEKSTLLLETNKILSQTRDVLLPRLISGKLSVEELDIQFPHSMQDQPLTPVNTVEACHA